MTMRSWLIEGIIYVYALSLSFYLADVIRKNAKAKQWGTRLLLLVWILQTVFFIFAVLLAKSFSAWSMFETLFIFSWVLTTLSLFLRRLLPIDILLFFMNVISFAGLVLNAFSSRFVPDMGEPLMNWKVENELLFFHIFLAVAGYAAFSVSAVLAGMYLFMHHRLKEKKWTQQLRRMPSLPNISSYMFAAVMTGIPLLFCSLSLGLIWVLVVQKYDLLFDPKVLNSFLVLAVYGWYVLQKMLHTPGNKLAVWNLAAFAVTVLNFIVSNRLSNFHQWS
jgi:HemX protein